MFDFHTPTPKYDISGMLGIGEPAIIASFRHTLVAPSKEMRSYEPAKRPGMRAITEAKDRVIAGKIGGKEPRSIKYVTN